MEINIKLHQTKIRPTSTNDLYMAVARKRHVGAFLTKNRAYREYESIMGETLRKVITDDQVTNLKDKIDHDGQLGLEFSMTIGMPAEDFTRIDISNLVKSTEDCVKVRLGIDDSRNCRVVSEKYPLPRGSEWNIDITVRTINILDHAALNEDADLEFRWKEVELC